MSCLTWEIRSDIEHFVMGIYRTPQQIPTDKTVVEALAIMMQNLSVMSHDVTIDQLQGILEQLKEGNK